MVYNILFVEGQTKLFVEEQERTLYLWVSNPNISCLQGLTTIARIKIGGRTTYGQRGDAPEFSGEMIGWVLSRFSAGSQKVNIF